SVERSFRIDYERSEQRFAHLDKMKGYLDAIWVGHLLGDAGFGKPELSVEAQEFGTMIDESQFHFAVTGSAGMCLCARPVSATMSRGARHDPRSQTHALFGGMD